MSVEHHQDLADELVDVGELLERRPGWPGPHPIDPDTGNPIVGEVPFPQPWGKRYTPPSSTRRRLPRAGRSAGGNLDNRAPQPTHDALIVLFDERGNPIGRVDPNDGALFTLAGGPSSPTVAKPRGGDRINRRHTLARRAAGVAGIQRSKRIEAWEHDQLSYVDGGRNENVVSAAIARVARGLRRAS